MKVLLIVSLLLTNSFAQRTWLKLEVAKPVLKPISVASPNDECSFCIDFATQALNQLLNIILNAGVIGTCSELCGKLADKVNSTLVGEICDIVCSIAGIEAFIDIIEKADLDPIYYCELLKLCPINDDGDAKIISFTVSPEKGPQGSQFIFKLTYKTVHGTGTGEIGINIGTVDGFPVGDYFLNEEQAPGTYGQQISLKTNPCDPSQEPCEMWLPGLYNASIALCNGECGSKHPHSQIYDQANCTFTITG